MLSRRSDAPWALSYRFYLLLGLLVVAVRVGFRVLFGGGYGARVILDLPAVPMPDWAAGITLLGPVTAESLLSGLYDGMRLAAILICVGAANTLANPRRLLAGLPAALYEVGTAVVIALSLFPQLAESLQRVRRARRLRGEPGKGIGALRRIVVPVLEDAVDRSLALAASMDARGYGRAGRAGPSERRLTGALLVGALIGLCVGSYAVLDATLPEMLGTPMLISGVALAVLGLWSAGRRVHRTRYRPDRWRLPDVLTALTGVAVVAVMTLGVERRPDVAIPDPAVAPALSLLCLMAVLLGLTPAVATPRPALAGAPACPRPRAAPAPVPSGRRAGAVP